VLRSLVERATRRSTLRRRLPRQSGGAPIYVSGSAGLKYLFRSMDRVDPVLCNLATEFVRSGHTVWDVGANVGLFSFSAAHHAGSAGQVVAFEPDVWLVQLLRRSASIQPRSSAAVEVVPVAVAAACDVRTFNLSSRSRATNALSGYGAGGAGAVLEQQSVPAISLDWFAERRPLPDVIKIDVESAELEVLTGATGVLDAKRPIVLCEVSSKNSSAITALLIERGYRLYDAEAAPSARTEVAAAPWSTLAIAGPR
jgi:FkbM family methyltransferase